jgi:hypothetical protein
MNDENYDEWKKHFDGRCHDCGEPIKDGFYYCKSCFLKRRRKMKYDNST